MQTDTVQRPTQEPTQNTTQWAEKTSFTLVEAAAFLEVRADDLTATLPSAGIDLSTHKDGLLTRDDVQRLEHLVRSIRRKSTESAYGVGNL